MITRKSLNSLKTRRRLNEMRRARRNRLLERNVRHRKLHNEATVALYPYEEIGMTLEEFIEECSTLIKGIKSDMQKPIEQLIEGDPEQVEKELNVDKLEVIKQGLASIMKTLGKVAYTAYDIRK